MLHSRLGRYSYVAADPFAEFAVKDGIAFWNGQPVTGEPMRILADRLEQYRQPIIEGVPPFQSGAVGYVAYEFGSQLERLPTIAPPRCGPIPTVAFAFYDVVWAFDHEEKKCWLISTGLPETSTSSRSRRARERARYFRTLADKNWSTELYQAPAIARESWVSNFSRQSYRDVVARVREAILDGEMLQANIAQRFVTPLPEGFSPWAFYKKLRKANPATFAAFLERGGLVIASSSPERFIATSADQVETRPIKGTIRREEDDPVEDRRRADSLASSEKDRAENVMIVDLMRNDLSRVCKPGSVDVPTLCEIETYAGVHHLVSAVTGSLEEGKGVVDLLVASFPGGSITGAPKIKAMEIIADVEKEERGVYCGSIGYLGFNGRADLNIAIRTVIFQNGVATFHVGGGITMLSDPDAEYIETLDKAEKIFKAFAMDPEVAEE
jgi:para-aminobenzoate synthetase component 1